VDAARFLTLGNKRKFSGETGFVVSLENVTT